MKQYVLILLMLLGLTLLLTGCKESDSNVISGLSGTNSSNDSSGTGCRGRNSGVKTGPSGLYLPYPNTVSYTVSQTWYGMYSHYFEGREHALDFPMNTNGDIFPVSSGKVIAVKEDSNVNCSSNCSYGNYVLIDHGGGYYGRYVHFCQNCVDVNPGDDVSADTRIGGAGNTGWSTNTHLHFELIDWEENCTVTYGFVENSNQLTALNEGTSYTATTKGTPTYSASQITGNAFLNVGITLTSSIDWYVTAGNTLTITGELTSEAQAEGSDAVAVFLVNDSFEVVASPATIQYESATTTFSFTYTVPAVSAGVYYLAISKSKSGSYWYNNPPYLVVY